MHAASAVVRGQPGHSASLWCGARRGPRRRSSSTESALSPLVHPHSPRCSARSHASPCAPSRAPAPPTTTSRASPRHRTPRPRSAPPRPPTAPPPGQSPRRPAPRRWSAPASSRPTSSSSPGHSPPSSSSRTSPSASSRAARPRATAAEARSATRAFLSTSTRAVPIRARTAASATSTTTSTTGTGFLLAGSMAPFPSEQEVLPVLEGAEEACRVIPGPSIRARCSRRGLYTGTAEPAGSVRRKPSRDVRREPPHLPPRPSSPAQLRLHHPPRSPRRSPTQRLPPCRSSTSPAPAPPSSHSTPKEASSSMSAGDEMDAIISGSGASGGLGVAGGSGGGGIPSNFDAENAQNDEGIEMQFAVMCMEQAEVYFGLITKIKPSELKRLTKWDDEIVEAFLAAFPEYDDADKLRLLSEEEIKSPAGKRRWRDFMMPFAKKIDEYNFGTLIRLDCTKDYTQENSMFGYRLQFYALEILRNRKGLNDAVWQKVQDDPTAFADAEAK